MLDPPPPWIPGKEIHGWQQIPGCRKESRLASAASSVEQTWWQIWPLREGFTYHPFVARLSLAQNRS
jgi:hypothetical protein